MTTLARTAVLVPGFSDVVSEVRWTIEDGETQNPTPGPEFSFSPE